MKRGDVVIVEFPYTDGRRGKNRPALIVQNDKYNGRLTNTVIAMISGNVSHADESTQVLLDPATETGATSGVHGRSVVKCCNLYTVRKQDILRIIGQLSDERQDTVNRALRLALGID